MADGPVAEAAYRQLHYYRNFQYEAVLSKQSDCLEVIDLVDLSGIGLVMRLVRWEICGNNSTQ